jgi:acyl transferase domain-containing protein
VSINAFGIGGVNAHVSLLCTCHLTFQAHNVTDCLRKAILESAPRMLQRKPASSRGDDAQLLILSAHTPKALKKKAQQLEEYLGAQPERLQDVVYTLSERREHLECRAFQVVLDGAVSALSPVESVSTTHRVSTFIFTGQGAQWIGMGRDLLARLDTFRASIANLDGALQALPDAPRWKIAGKLPLSRNKTILSSVPCSAE